MERVTRIELASPAWKAGALAIVLHPHQGFVLDQRIARVSLVIITWCYRNVNRFLKKLLKIFEEPNFLAKSGWIW